VFPIDWAGLQREYAYFWAHNHWGGIRRGMRVATFAGHPVAGPSQRHPPFWAHSWHDNEVFFSSQHLSETNLPHYVARLRRFRPEMIHGYPSSIYLLALFVRDRGVHDIRPRAVFTGSETLFEKHRDAIYEAFGVRPLNWYGNSEMIGNIVECEGGRMHIRELHSVLEVLDEDGLPVEPGGTGELVCTSLGNRAMPMFRYRIGDRVTLASTEQCVCGRGGRLVAEVQGRDEDVIVTPDGRHVGRLDHIFKDLVQVAEAQVVQTEVAAVILRIVRRAGYTEADSRKILAEARLRLGDAIRIDLQFVDRIPRAANGKIRFAVSSVPIRLGRRDHAAEDAP
jgi:phenylacetate-CoA ligase